MGLTQLKLKRETRSALAIGVFFMFLGVLFGAFGAHALKKYVDAEVLLVWETGVRYQLFHGVALLALAALAQTTELPLKLSRRLLVVGTILFSFNCYSYTVTGLKFFAMIIPVGGTLLLVGWGLMLSIILLKTKSA